MQVKRLGEFAPLENELIVSAETLIQRQRDKIGQLKAKIKELDSSKHIQKDRTWAEIENLKADNANLRLEIDLLHGELLAHVDVEDSRVDEKKGIHQDFEIARSRLRELAEELEDARQSLGNLPQQNADLRQLNHELQCKLKQTLPNSIGMEHHRLVEQVEALKREVKEYEQGLRAIKIKEEESRAACAAVADAELELMEARERVKHQKKTIESLQNTVDALNREKALMPPTLLMVKHPPKREDRDAALDLWLDGRIKAIEPMIMNVLGKLDTSNIRPLGGAPYGDGINGQVVKKLIETINEVSQRQAEMDSRSQKLTQLDTREMSRTQGLHCALRDFQNLRKSKTPTEIFDVIAERVSHDIEHKGLLLVEKILSCGKGFLKIFNEDEAYQPEYNLDIAKCIVSWRKERRAFAIRHEVAVGEIEGHWLQMNSTDDFDRLFYTSQYAGFVERGIAADESMSRMHGVLIAPDDSYPMDRTEAPFARYSVDLWMNLSQGEIGFISEKAVQPFLKFSVAETSFYPDSESQCFRFWVGLKDRIPLAIFAPNYKEFYEKSLSTLMKFKWHKISERPPVLTFPQFENLTTELEAAQALINYQDMQRQPSPPIAVQAVPVQPPTSKATPKAFEPFVIADGKLCLYDREGGEPVLTLINQDTRCVFDDGAQRFDLTKVDAKGNPVNDFVFEFADTEVYNNYKSKLKENGFFERSMDAINPDNFNEYAVVEPGIIKMYAKDGKVVSILAETSQLITDPVRKEISILEKYEPTGKSRRYKLDCANDAEYQNWIWGLTFGGFLKDRKDLPEILSGMKRFRFPIQMTGTSEVAKDLNEWVKIDNKTIRIYLLAGDDIPAYVCKTGQGKMYSNMRNRIIQIRRNVGSIAEDRLDLLLPTIAAFDQLLEKLGTHGYNIVNLQTPSPITIPAQYKGKAVLARRRGLIYWENGVRNVNKDEPTWVFPKDIYQAVLSERGEARMVFTMKTNVPADIAATQRVIPSFEVFLKPPNDNKWKLAAYVGGLQFDYPIHSPRYKQISEAQLAQKAPIYVFLFSPEDKMRAYTPLGIKILQRRLSHQVKLETKRSFLTMVMSRKENEEESRFTVESETKNTRPDLSARAKQSEAVVTRYSVLGDIKRGSGYVKQIGSGSLNPRAPQSLSDISPSQLLSPLQSPLPSDHDHQINVVWNRLGS